MLILPSKRHLDRFLTIVAGLACAITALASAHFLTSSGDIFWTWPSGEPSVFGPFRSRNNYASFIALTLPVVAWQGAGGARSRWGWLVAAAWMGASVIASGSRAGSAIVVLEALAFALLLRRRRLLAVGGVLLGVAFAATLGWETLLVKLRDEDPLRYRREMAASAVDMARAKPLLGQGLGSFAGVYPAYARFDSGHHVNFAHNDWAEWAASGGLPFVAFLAGWALWVSRAGIRAVWGIGIPAVFLHALVDYPFPRIGLAAWVWTLSAAAIVQLSGNLSGAGRSAADPDHGP